jgi:TRAP-type C4-dicarboxylate transport system permease small subunit
MAALRVATNLALVSLVVVVLAAVVVRYFGVFPGSLHWAAEYSRFGIVWIVMLGSAVALDHGAHVAIDFTDHLPPQLCRAARRIGFVLGLLFLAVLAWQGFRLTGATMRQLSPSLRIPVGYAYLALPIGATIMAVQSVLFALFPELQERRSEIPTAAEAPEI